MIDFLEREIVSNTPPREDPGSAVLLESYAQETEFPMHSLKFARAWGNEADILYVLHCRALGEIAAGPDSASKGSPLHNALVKHYHAYRRMAATRFKTVKLENILPHPSWLILYDPDFVFSKAKQLLLMANRDLAAQCTDLLERYYSWWLKGEGQIKNDLHQRMNKSGVLDPIEDISRVEWELFYKHFPAIYFALTYLARYGEDLRPVEKIALTDVNGVPDFPGFDLWLQRKALACAVQARKTTFLMDNIEQDLRALLIYYTFLRFDFVRKEREQIIQGMRSLLKQRCENDEFDEEVNKYMKKMSSFMS